MMSLKMFWINIFEIYAKVHLGYYYLLRLATSFLEETFLVYPNFKNFTQRKRKTYNVNDLSALSLVSIIVYIYYLGKKWF